MVFGTLVHHLFVVGGRSPGAVCRGRESWAACSRPLPRPALTAIASVAEMTANFTLTLPMMLTCGVAAAVSKHLSYGSVYTTKLLRRGIDIRTAEDHQRATEPDCR